MEDKYIVELLEKYNKGALAPAEKAILESWYVSHAANNKHDISKEEIDRNLHLVADGLPLNYARPKTYWPRIAAAAVILSFVSIGLIFYKNGLNTTETPKTVTVEKNDLPPGGNRAILTLSDGSKISLTDANAGQVAEQSGIRITKTGDGQLLYEVLDVNNKTSVPEFNTIETPVGGQYQVMLPDGSKVWLNAASSLEYPASFTSMEERTVKLTGEAYFQVAKDKAHPFIVTTTEQQVKVTGTEFNINAYTEEPVVKTTLLEGSVLVNRVGLPGVKGTNSSNLEAEAGIVLRPGQQTILSPNSLRVSKANTVEVVAWRNGYFRFDNESLESMMRKISRWYGIDEVIWKDTAMKNELYAAVTSRFSKVSELLTLLEETGDAKFEIQDRKVTISSQKK